MFETDFKRLIIFTSIFGLLGILVIMYLFEASVVSVNFLVSNDSKEGVYITSGKVKDIEQKSNTLFFKLCDSSNCISSVYFNPSSSVLDSLKKTQLQNKEIKVKARFEYYYGVPELVIYKFFFESTGDYS